MNQEKTIRTGAGILFDFALFCRMNYRGNLNFFIHNDNKGRIVFGFDHCFMMLPRKDLMPGLKLLDIHIPGDDINIRPLVIKQTVSEQGQPMPIEINYGETRPWRDVFKIVWQNRPEIGEQVELKEYCYKANDESWHILPQTDRQDGDPGYLMYHKRMEHKNENLIVSGTCKFSTLPEAQTMFCYFNANLLDFFRLRGFNVHSNNRANFQPFPLSRDGKTFEGIIMPVKLNSFPR